MSIEFIEKVDMTSYFIFELSQFMLVMSRKIVKEIKERGDTYQVENCPLLFITYSKMW